MLLFGTLISIRISQNNDSLCRATKNKQYVVDEYVAHYNCKPPPLFMILISVIEVSVLLSLVPPPSSPTNSQPSDVVSIAGNFHLLRGRTEGWRVPPHHRHFRCAALLSAHLQPFASLRSVALPHLHVHSPGVSYLNERIVVILNESVTHKYVMSVYKFLNIKSLIHLPFSVVQMTLRWCWVLNHMLWSMLASTLKRPVIIVINI